MLKRLKPSITLPVFVIILAAGLGWQSLCFYRHYFGMYHDDAIYMVCAKALAEGQGYHIISLPSSPFETKYPLGFPIMLSLIWRLYPIFPSNLSAYLVLQMVLAFGAYVLATLYLLKTRKITLNLALVILAASMLNSHFIDFAPMVMSDFPYALMAISSLWILEASVAKIPSLKNMLMLAVVVIAACSIRAQGLILMPVILVYLASKKRRKKHLCMAVATLAMIALALMPQFVWQYFNQEAKPTILSFYTTYFSHAYGTLPTGGLLNQFILANLCSASLLQINTYYPLLKQIHNRFLHHAQHGILNLMQFELVYKLLYPLLGLPFLLGLAKACKSMSPPGLYCLFYGLVLFFWPVPLEWRHILPVLPFAYYFCFAGFRSLAKALKPKTSGMRIIYSRTCSCLCILFTMYLSLGTAAQSLAHASKLHGLTPTAQMHEADRVEAYAWIKTHTRMEDRFVSNNDPQLFLYTGRKAILASPMEIWRIASHQLVDASSLDESINLVSAKYVIVEPIFRGSGLITSQTEQAIDELSRQRPGELLPVFTSSHRLIRIFAVNYSKPLANKLFQIKAYGGPPNIPSHKQ